ncbi:hypothetical protein [Clostridium omnivorum]|uniref:Uncharacterized protein n=1 Tax=Clostridium omnivorum TaxID=1604902 RepID=A0ABQ5N7P2_9CLOT|nr:hypothetical protein [Clostridium sp. E14]GLC31156.1 hypothetical protein bsdE14_25660 [Clostridium sp. E14]
MDPIAQIRNHHELVTKKRKFEDENIGQRILMLEKSLKKKDKNL